MKKISIYIITLLFIGHSYGQEIKIGELKNWQLKGYAKSAERLGDNYSATDFIEEYVKREPKDHAYAFKLASLYFESKNYSKAKVLYQKLYNHNHKEYINTLFYCGEILKTEMKYDSAQECFLQFRDAIADNKNRSIYSYLVNVEIESCDYVLKNPKANIELVLSHLNNSINKIHLESAPLIFNDSTMIYSSMTTDSLPIISSNEITNLPVNQFHTAKLQNNIWQGNFEAPEPFYNFDNQNTANGVFSHDKQRFYFTKANRNWKNKIIGTLYVSYKKKGIWLKPVKLDQRINLKKYTSTQPAISNCYDKNYEVIYFISDRPEGWGGKDIWYTVFDKSLGTYKKPINAGGNINTPVDEITPFYDNQNEILYFSSNGLVGYGGYDIFKSKGSLVNWTPAENAGLPLNSSFDDIYYCKFMDKNEGFLVSNRDGALYFKNPNCCFDIFEFSISENPVLINSSIIAEKTQLINDNNKVDSSSIVSMIKHTIDNKMIKLEQENLNANSSNNNAAENKEITNKESFVFGNIYFEFNKSELTQESKNLIDTTILFIMKEYPNIVLEIGAYTDNIGSENYNMELSQKRANSVVKYLINNGIEHERLVPVGYGKSNPLFIATDLNGNELPTASEKNRRIEIKLLGVLAKVSNGF